MEPQPHRACEQTKLKQKQNQVTSEGLVHDPKAKGAASHYLWDSSIQKNSNRFFWNNIKGVIEEFIKKCDRCQKQGEI